jgi:putative phosphoesterase
MILGIVSDTHLTEPAGRLEWLLDGPLREATHLAHAGDFTAPEVVDHLEWVDPRPFYGVLGNSDRASLSSRLPPLRHFTLAGHTVALTHGQSGGVGRERRLLELLEEPMDLLIFGHTHRPFLERVGKTLLLNPGSPFEPRHGGAGTVALAHIGPKGITARLIEVSR